MFRLFLRNSLRAFKINSPIMISALSFSYTEEDSKYPTSLPAKPIQYYPENELTHRYLLKQSSILSADSANKLLTHHVMALTDGVNKYLELLGELSNMYEHNAVLIDSLSERITEIQVQISELKDYIYDMEFLFGYIRKLCDASAEITFITDSEFVSVQMSERLHAASNTVKELLEKAKLAELDLVMAKQKHISNMDVDTLEDKVITDFEEEAEKIIKDEIDQEKNK